MHSRTYILLIISFLLIGDTALAQCISSQSSYLVPGCGNTEMVLNASQPDVQYSMINQRTGVRTGGNNGQGNGGSVSVGLATSTDVYFVRAKKPGCPDSIDFGHRMITVYPPPQPQQIIGGTYYCSNGGGNGVDLSLTSTETGVEYELLLDGSDWLGVTFQGTGTNYYIGSFGYLGTYTIRATRLGSACSGIEFGNHAVTGIRSLPFFDGFNNFNLSPYYLCWDDIYEVGSSSISLTNTSSSPSTSPYEGSHFTFWNSADPSYNNTRTRMQSSAINTIGTSSVEVEFYWRNNNNPSFSTGNYLLEGVQLQYSLDGNTWTNAGPFMSRHDNTLASGTSQWKKKSIILPAAAGNKNTVYIGFSFRAFGGNNCALDAITVKPVGVCTPVFAVQTRDINHNSARVNFSGSGNYLVEYGPPGFTPGSLGTAGVNGTVVAGSNSSIPITGLSSSTTYDLYVRQDCGGGTYSTNSSKINFTTACPSSTIPYRQNFDDITSLNPSCLRLQSFSGGSWFFDNFSGGSSSPNAFSLQSYDDWFFLPGLSMTGGTSYRLRLRYKTTGSSPNIQIRYGLAADSTSQTLGLLFNGTNLTNTIYQLVDVNFTPLTSGIFYLGFHGSGYFGGRLTIDDISLDVTPPCSSDIPTINVSALTGTSANFTWSSISSGYQYAVTPSQIPPVSGTSTGTAAASITGLTGSTKYYVHVRSQCSPGVYGNWNSVGFITMPDCASSPLLNICTEVEAILPAGTGYWDFAGTYPNNSLGHSTPGKEKIYRFTVPDSGVYYLDITKADSYGTIDYFYKKTSDGCSNLGWIPIYAHSYYTRIGNYALGMLQPNTEYALLLDAAGTFGETQSFRICKALVNEPSVLNEFTGSSLPFTIPPNSNKIQYLIDVEGNLIASFDFSEINWQISGVGASVFKSSGPIRRNSNIEYLDRNFSFYRGASSGSPVKIRLYFGNAELQRLIDEPNDGIADVNTINDVRVTQVFQNSLGEEDNVWMETVGTGTYDASSSYIEIIPIATSGTLYLHGGDKPIITNGVEQMICPGSSASFFWLGVGTGNYQWQVDAGSGFVDITDNSIYSGTNSIFLQINNPPNSFAGYRYRVVYTRQNVKYYGALHILKIGTEWYGGYSADWHDPNNWYCGIVPDEFTDVIISDAGFWSPIINANAVCRSLTIKEGKTVTVNGGFKLEIKGKQ